MRSKLILVVPVVVVVALAVGIAFRSQRQSASPSTSEYNVVLISIDTLRADHLACYGNPTIRTPHIDQLAAEGTLCEQCTSSVPLTLPSHATILTGTQPYVHGARDNGHFYLHEDNVTLPEVLKPAGYATLAEVGAYVINHEYGIAQGFDVYHDVEMSAGTVGIAERRADEVCDGALRLLEEHQHERFFLFVHFYDPHFPYDPPSPYAAEYNDPYVGEIAFVDAQIGRLMDALRRLKLGERTLVVLVSDHGEARGEHNEESHGVYVYDATMSVPMVWWCPGRLPAGQRLGAQVRLVDVAPTMLEFLGAEPLANAQGVSLLPYLAAEAPAPAVPAYSESLMAYYNWGYAPIRALRADGWKYIHSARPQLYHIAVDPHERDDIADKETERAEDMRAELQLMIVEAPVVANPRQAERQASVEDVERLRGLGYVDTGHHAQESDALGEVELLELAAQRPDAHDHADEIDKTQAALHNLILRDYAEAERLLREFIQLRGEGADAAWAFKNLGLALARQGRHHEALENYRHAIALDPSDGATLTNYGLSLTESGRLEDAEAVFRQALQIKPVLPSTHEAYGLALHRMGRVDAAAAQFLLATKIAPGDLQVRARLGRLLLESGRVPEAIDELRAGVAIAPDVPQLREILAEAYLRTGRVNEAVAELRRVVALDATRAAAWHILAFAQLRSGNTVEAATAFRNAADAEPDNVTYVNDLAWLLATCADDALRDGATALQLAQRARELSEGQNMNVLDTQAAALAELGRFEEAVHVVDEAITLARNAGDEDKVASLEQRRKLYGAERPYRMTP